MCDKQVVYGGKYRLQLPTKNDYLALQSCFKLDANDPRDLSVQGLKDLYDTFRDMKNRWFWSSTVSENRYTPFFAYYFSGYYGRVGSAGYRDLPYAVRCVVVKPSKQLMLMMPSFSQSAAILSKLNLSFNLLPPADRNVTACDTLALSGLVWE